MVRKGSYTFEEFMEISDEEGKWEISGGEIVMHSPLSLKHENIVSRVISAFIEAEYRGKGKVFGSNAVFRLSERTGYAPDVIFVSKDRLHLVKGKYFEGAPDIACEVVSESTKRYDVSEKLPKYQEA